MRKHGQRPINLTNCPKQRLPMESQTPNAIRTRPTYLAFSVQDTKPYSEELHVNMQRFFSLLL